MRTDCLPSVFDKLTDQFYESREKYLDLLHMIEQDKTQLLSCESEESQNLKMYLQFIEKADIHLKELSCNRVKSSRVISQMRGILADYRYFTRLSTRIAKKLLNKIHTESII